MPSFSHPFYCITRLTLLLQGHRAILIDRDRNPKVRSVHLIMDNPEFTYQELLSFLCSYFQWEPSKLELIRDDDVDRYFSKVDDEDWEDLKLPPRSNLPQYAIAKL